MTLSTIEATSTDAEQPQQLNNAQQPVAWGCFNTDGEILDVISPAEHAEAEGDYTVPLYAKPVLP